MTICFKKYVTLLNNGNLNTDRSSPYYLHNVHLFMFVSSSCFLSSLVFLPLCFLYGQERGGVCKLVKVNCSFLFFLFR